jgi:hypothetical protein
VIAYIEYKEKTYMPSKERVKGKKRHMLTGEKKVANYRWRSLDPDKLRERLPSVRSAIAEIKKAQVVRRETLKKPIGV